jgi:hypothetical protein
MVAGGVLFFSGCDEGQDQALAQCELNALSTYKEPKAAGYGYYISACMRAAGFRWYMGPTKCEATDPLSSAERNPYCYSPTGSLSRLLWRVRISVFDGGFDY